MVGIGAVFFVMVQFHSSLKVTLVSVLYYFLEV